MAGTAVHAQGNPVRGGAYARRSPWLPRAGKSPRAVRPPRTRLVHRTLLFPVLLAALVSLPQLVSFGPVSGLGALTVVQVGVALGGLLACRHYPRWLLLRTVPYVAFLGWAAASVTWVTPDLNGVQNWVVYTLFFVLLALSGTLTARNGAQMHHLLGRSVAWIHWIGLGIVAANLAIHGGPGDHWFVGPRAVALVGLVPMCWYLAEWYYGRQVAMLSVLLWLAAIVATMSRTATAVALLLIALVSVHQLRFRPGRAVSTLLILMAGASLTGSLLFYSETFNERLFEGDTSLRIAGVKINASGRMNMWTVTIESGRESPVMGKGLGSSQVNVAQAYAGIGHPHNDYLRIWHDLGTTGLVLLLLGVGSWLWILCRDWYGAERRREGPQHLRMSALLALLALLLVMLTDNAIVYSFVMAPTAVLVGAGLGTRRLRRPPAWATAPLRMRAAG